MTTDTFSQYSETGPLKKVIVGSHRGYRKEPAYEQIVNESQKNGLPEVDMLEREFAGFMDILKKYDVEVLTPEYVGKFVYDQLTPRDIGVTIGDKFVLCNMANSSRRYESAGIFPHILAMSGAEPTILIPPDHDVLLEGGDIIIDKECIFVGISQRTNEKGFQFLRQTFADQFDVVPVYCRSLGEDEDILHLDCAFNPVGEEHALIYYEGFRDIPDAMNARYTWIPVDRQEQAALATNVLSVNTTAVIARDHPHCRSVNQRLADLGFYVNALSFDAAPSTGGSFRCCSLPLVRN